MEKKEEENDNDCDERCPIVQKPKDSTGKSKKQ